MDLLLLKMSVDGTSRVTFKSSRKAFLKLQCHLVLFCFLPIGNLTFLDAVRANEISQLSQVGGADTQMSNVFFVRKTKDSSPLSPK